MPEEIGAIPEGERSDPLTRGAELRTDCIARHKG